MGAILLLISPLALQAATNDNRHCNAIRLAASCERDPCDRAACEGRLEAGLVSVAMPTTGYEATCLCSGDDYYTDRYWLPQHQLACVPDALSGAVWIRTMNEDKVEQGTKHLELTLGSPATVYIAYDSRIVSHGSPPDWLTGQFELSDVCLDIDEPDVLQEFALYHRRFDASKVVLGGNSAPGAQYDDDGSNYIVAVVPEGEAPFALDSDHDGRPDTEDNCSLIANVEQSDCDLDGRGDACDADYTNDGHVNLDDFSMFAAELSRWKTDGVFDTCVDANGDGQLDDQDLQMLVEALIAESGEQRGLIPERR